MTRHKVVIAGLFGLALLLVPLFASSLYIYLVTDVLIWGLFAMSLNLLVGYTGLVSFGHAAYFGVGAYVCGLLMQAAGLPFTLSILAAAGASAAIALVVGFFCVRLTQVYFAMLTLAFAQILWAICFRWNEVTGGDQGITGIPYPDFSLAKSLPLLGGFTNRVFFYWLVLAIVAGCILVLWRLVRSPFGLVLQTIRENPQRAAFIGIDVKRVQLAAFVIAGTMGGVAGALFGIFNRGLFPDLMHWTKGAEVLIMVVLGGTGNFFGPMFGAMAVLWLHQELTSITEYWSLFLGLILAVLVLKVPGGLAELRGPIGRLAQRVRPGARGQEAPRPVSVEKEG